jgi:asparagine synthase (glutamine-hydrolysing)
MNATLVHRGPDDAGVWTDAAAGLALGFRRLAILDLSPEGHQPMASASGRYTLAFNGEVYNFLELRAELEGLGHRFRGHSDTEVMLAAFEEWGVEASVPRFNGMFAFAAWDRQGRRLVLARDRLGVKPLYYGWAGGAFLCGSELKALRAYPGFAPDIDRGALALYLRHNYVPAPLSIYKNVFKLPPGTLLSLDTPQPPGPTPVAYWSVRAVAERGAAEPFRGSDRQAVVELDALLRDSVKHRMIADVPLGAFLSGGIDSSTVVALMQAQSSRPVKTFTIGFREDAYDEARYAGGVARHLGTDHTELYVTPAETLAVIPRLPDIYDEPFADSSQIPTFLVSQLARRHVTVSLSGDGGDELFGGYTRYFATNSVWRKISWVPKPVARAVASGLVTVPPPAYNAFSFLLRGPMRRLGRVGPLGDKVHKFADLLGRDSLEGFYQSFNSHWPRPADVVVGGHEPTTVMTDPAQRLGRPGVMDRMMYLDTVTYLPDDILVKVDRASMAVSLEARVPLIDDHRVAEFAWRLPLAMKVRDGQGKWLLRQVLEQYVPKKLYDRPKMGFGVPIDEWLCGPLREWAEGLLDPQRLRREGYFHPEPVRRKWDEHLAGRRRWHYHLWDVLMFQAWLERWRRPS